MTTLPYDILFKILKENNGVKTSVTKLHVTSNSSLIMI